jgi:predicted nucleotidyltransferase
MTMSAATLQDLRRRRDELLTIASRHGATDVRVFGSVARGDDTGDRDVDFLVRLEKGRSLLDLVALKHSLQDTLSRAVDVVSENGIFHYLRPRLLHEAKPL